MVEENEGAYGRAPPRSTLLKIVILGDGGVGKSCLMSRFISNHFDDHSFHTIGVEFMNKTIEVGSKQYTLQAEERLAMIEEQRKMDEERQKLKKEQEKRVKEEQKKILGKNNSRPKLSFSLKPLS